VATGNAGRRFVYEHPAEAGFAEHHADAEHAPLDERPADRFGTNAPMTGLAPGELTMADLDMPHGTVVTLREHDDGGEHDEAGQVVGEWTDQFGTQRATGFDPDFFAEHFTEVKE